MNWSSSIRGWTYSLLLLQKEKKSFAKIRAIKIAQLIYKISLDFDSFDEYLLIGR